MLRGLMQDWPLTLDRILVHARTAHGEREVVSRSHTGHVTRTNYTQIHDRARRLSAALVSLGIKPGDRVATLAWNTARHVEAWYAIMGIGAVCHTLNPRLFPEQLCYIVNHASDRIVILDASCAPLFQRIRARLACVEHVVMMGDGEDVDAAELPDALSFESLIAQDVPSVAWGGFDELSAAGLCYTSGTTGSPKGVLYSHRSNFLHTLVSIGPDLFNLSARDVVLPIVPMFHANAWGLAFSAPAVGAKLVLPGPMLDGASIYELLESEGVTFSAGVPTVWHTLLQHLRATGAKLHSLKRVLTGGAALPETILRSFGDEHGVTVSHAWGMTETSPLATQSTPTAKVAAMDSEEQLRFALKQGRPPLSVELKLAGPDGQTVPRDGKHSARLKVRGPFVAAGYFRGDTDVLDEDGFLDTGDIATIDDHGFVRITDRAKDIIKSGGEWISSIDVENIALGHPKVLMAAVIGVEHPRWTERPLLIVKLRNDVTATEEELRSFLAGKMAAWWIPDAVAFVEEMPLGPTGKVDKRALRDKFSRPR